MTAVAFSEKQLDEAYAVSAAIGSAIRAARRERRERVEDVARACGTHPTSVRNIERGASPNVKLGNVSKILTHYGLALAVVPITDRSTP